MKKGVFVSALAQTGISACSVLLCVRIYIQYTTIKYFAASYLTFDVYLCSVGLEETTASVEKVKC
jgi:hypothetical protein